ncbi:DUF3429 domain-containing protein [Undibacterium pigrum]|uniref:Uncharacterized protein DUF3429 n=1 Tax=Undibacterium pigrum TaxID=401470 RepID=A0A318IN18_9BURK|nr:DUF3429 domain-containing protein [Undibacterium pigrum]PXX36849.1 uncharacterized protein DUF3429 [Undibacterium pigrum]
MNNLNQKLAVRIGFAGLAPFVFLTLACWIVHPEWLGALIKAQLHYGIVILSFLGGLHWGVVLMAGGANEKETKKALIWGVVPIIIAWLFMSQMLIGFVVQVAGFIMTYKIDKRLYQSYGVPEWFINLRLQLTRVVVGAQIFTFIAANVRNYPTA